MEKVSLISQFSLLKNTMKILLPVSVFSLVFSQYSSLLPRLLDSFHDFSSSFSVQLFTYSTERNYIFLLCNGILVFIIKNSGLISKPTAMNINSEYPKDQNHKEKSREYQNPATISEAKIEVPEKVVDEKQGVEEEGTIVSVETIEIIENEDDDVEIIESEDEDEETLEELHRKCDDFIKRIKKEISTMKK